MILVSQRDLGLYVSTIINDIILCSCTIYIAKKIESFTTQHCCLSNWESRNLDPGIETIPAGMAGSTPNNILYAAMHYAFAARFKNKLSPILESANF